MKNKHLDYDELIDYLDNPIGFDEDKIIEEHLFICNRCTKELEILDTMIIGMESFGKSAAKMVRENRSPHLNAEELFRYARDKSPFEEKEHVFLHIAGCNKCSDNILAVKKLYNQLETEPVLNKKREIYFQFAKKYREGIRLIKDEISEFINRANKLGFKIVNLSDICNNTFSFGFSGYQETNIKQVNIVWKIEDDDFAVEMSKINNKTSSVMIGIMAKKDFKQAKVTICVQNHEAIETIPLRHRNAIIHKEGVRIDSIDYIKVEGDI